MQSFQLLVFDILRMRYALIQLLQFQLVATAQARRIGFQPVYVGATGEPKVLQPLSLPQLNDVIRLARLLFKRLLKILAAQHKRFAPHEYAILRPICPTPARRQPAVVRLGSVIALF